MEKLVTELQRLYFLREQCWHSRRPAADGEPGHAAEGALTPAIVADSLAGGAPIALDLLDADGTARVMVVGFKQAADWEQAAKLYQAVQSELELPAPAISVSGRAGYRLWFSLAEPVAAAQARSFLAALRGKYLADIPAARLGLCPDGAAPALATLAPAIHPATGKWSAFIDPSMGGMFVDAPGLELAPNMDRQADILAGLKSIKARDFLRALDILSSQPAAEQPAKHQGDTAASSASATRRPRSTLNVGSNFSDPQSFLLAVMNDPSASPRQRIEAAKALLPYFAQVPPK